MSSVAQQVAEQFDEIVKPDGGSVTFVSAEAGVLRVRYVPGSNEECETCVMAPDSLAAMMKDMVQGLDPSIQQVEIEE